MCTSFVIWYIVDGKTGGVIAMLLVFIFVEFYFLIKFPRFTIIAILSMVTQILIIGYELEVRKLGVKVGSKSPEIFSRSISDAHLARLQREPDSPHIRSIFLRHIGLYASLEACLLPLSGQSSHTPSRIDHSSGKILESLYISWQTIIPLCTLPSECVFEAKGVT